MFAYVARQPIFDINRKVHAYEILFRDGEQNCFPDIAPDEATSKILTSTHLSLGIEEITNNKPAFINFHRDTLMFRFPTSLDPSAVVIEIVETVDVDDKLVAACQQISEMGYKLALDDYDTSGKWDPFLPYVSVIKIDITTVDHATIRDVVPLLQKQNIKLVAERIETYEEFNTFKDMGFDYFQGYFFARPEIVRHRKLGASKLAMLELIAASSSEKLDFAKLSAIIERDPSLTYLLLRFINNPLFNKRHQISSLKHALNYMGEVEVKKFVALLALANLSDGQPSELMQMSLLRAKFCELVSLELHLEENPPTGFLTGLLSMMDAMMEQDMEGLMQKVPVADEVKDALCGRQNLLFDCLAVVQHIEHGNWAGIKRFSAKHQLKQTLVHHFYNEAIKWARAMHSSVNSDG
ncbi:EAL domain-containing protein [Alteromonas sp. ASW11-19]|uniref:EAL domain-containing protein n=1 Tax=Alteromonas salexigens TaxID=2982530 RepID=A0ABT2VRI5_9ALTE|nr:EAL domain-containing protein [Alteromonas salexigens]MCU7554534.1 EAL domain-containing protein [Alteromonas salexigens]